ncbi:heterokaryon incompatibility protein-domain-containing protein [Echria macrotheca]|uniref:Heterokaryon incompatibility protein-domain-containing protein n=1 Tax=Echria macrotheca TaxID=438768 RepID=A0AAJ0BH28_9PEZI|nr:heterokaryon incompatibility protein-domain-containing protein [Echria macrotheca]
MDTLCESCRTIDWTALSRRHEYTLNKPRTLTASHDELRASTCKACRAIATIKPNSLDGQDCVLTSAFLPLSAASTRVRHELCVTVAVGSPPSTKIKNMEHGCLAVLPTADIGSESVTSGAQRVHPHVTSLDYVKKLVSVCEQHHIETCRPPERSSQLGIFLIDCATRAVIPAPEDCEYLALSYVWGNSATYATCDTFPPAVSDAMKVTTDLGYRYLWVDRYCIDQDDEEFKHKMIAGMGQIYAGAILTIVAASGNSADHGLCGISRPRNPQQHEVQIGDTTLIQIFPHGSVTLASTSWATRGWTYQEGYLSRRRLFFTDQQTLFVCNGAYVAECARSLESMAVTSAYGNRRLRHLIPTDFSERFPTHDRAAVLLSQIEEYSKRTLSYSTDSLRAFLGILIHYNKPKGELGPIKHLWGVPIYRRMTPWNMPEPHLALGWRHEAPAVRRAAFPSWSWTGWEGAVHFSGAPILLVSNDKSKISVRERDGAEVHLSRVIYQGLAYHEEEDGRLLYIAADIVPLSFRQIVLSEDQQTSSTTILFPDDGFRITRPRTGGRLAIFDLDDTTALGLVPYLDDQDDSVESLEEGMPGLVLYTNMQRQMRPVCILMLKEVGAGRFERIGIIVLHHGHERIFSDRMSQNLPMVYMDKTTGAVLDHVEAAGELAVEGSKLCLAKARRQFICLA